MIKSQMLCDQGFVDLQFTRVAGKDATPCIQDNGGVRHIECKPAVLLD